MARVTMLVHEENGKFGASFPDFPGCTTVADDLDTLVEKAPQVLAWHIASMIEDELELPRVRSLNDLWSDPQFQADKADAAYATQLAIELPGRAVRINITAEESALDRIDRAAKAAGESRSAFLVAAGLKRARELLNRTDAKTTVAAVETSPRDRPARHRTRASGRG